jgi:oxygen-dependent protoporphyrinogen oxidase
VEAGLGERRLVANPAAARRFLVRGGRMRLVPLNPLRFAAAGILGPTGLLRMLAEPLVPRSRLADESAWHFARRRLGRQAAERLIAPMVLGVYAGDARRLSLPAAFPRIAALEREHGSLVRGMLQRRAAGQGGGPGGPAGALTSFPGGVRDLPARLAASDGVEVACRAPVEAVRHDGDSWQVVVGKQVRQADALVLAGEAWAMAPVLERQSPELSRRLQEIEYPTICVVALGYAAAGATRVPPGFGVLVRRGEGIRMLGCLWDSHLFPDRAPASHVLVRAMLGGAVDAGVARLDDHTLVRLVREELAKLMSLDAPPVFERVIRWPRAIPQYTLGHLDRKAGIEREAARLPGLFLAGNYLAGIAFGKAAAAGVDAAEHACDWLWKTP